MNTLKIKADDEYKKSQYDKLVKIEKTNSISSQHALIDYDIEEKSLFLTNIKESKDNIDIKECPKQD